ncbi:MAG TPA: hypothetical protein VEJ63_10100, partial [Planctomycetota bacterium]|nr:hypothetical protein [Planctomycetota bacterium]
VLDPYSQKVQDFCTTLALAERRTAVMPPMMLRTFIADEERKKLETTLSDFESWRAGGYADERLSENFARRSDYLVSAEQAPREQHWSAVQAFGDVRVYKSLLRTTSGNSR